MLHKRFWWQRNKNKNKNQINNKNNNEQNKKENIRRNESVPKLRAILSKPPGGFKFSKEEKFKTLKYKQKAQVNMKQIKLH